MAGIRVTTWNVENFSSEAPNFAAKLGHLVATLERLDPDVIALQEILDEAAAAQLAADLGYEATLATPDGRGNRVGFLTRTEPAGSEEITAWQLKPGVVVQELDNQGQVRALAQLGRPALKVTVSHDGSEVDLINAHLKSKLLTFPGGIFSTKDESLRAAAAYFALQRRSAEASTLREHVTALLKNGRNVILLGDFNDGPHAATTEMFYGPPGSQPRGPEDGAKKGAFQQDDAGDAARLFNVTMFVPAEKRWSRKHEGQPELLDQVLSSVRLMPRKGAHRQVPAVEILNADSPNRGVQPETSGVIPDHAPVTASFA